MVTPQSSGLPPADELRRWIEEARRGNQQALGGLLEACRPYLLLIANEELDADLRAKVAPSDLVQETLLRAQQEFGRFKDDSEDQLLAWLRRILLNYLANVRRDYQQTGKRQVGREVPLAELPPEELGDRLIAPGPSPSSGAEARERDEQLQQALARLSEPHREVIRLRSYERRPFEEVGRELGRSADAARKLWVRAILELQQILEHRDEPN